MTVLILKRGKFGGSRNLRELRGLDEASKACGRLDSIVTNPFYSLQYCLTLGTYYAMYLLGKRLHFKVRYHVSGKYS